MFGPLALVAAIVFLVLILLAFRGSTSASLAIAAPVTAAAAGVLALLHWSSTGDSRWLIGGILLLGALALSLLRANRSLAIGAAVLGLLATALCGIATAKPARAVVAASSH